MTNKTPRRHCHCIDSVYMDTIDLSHKPERDQRTEGKKMTQTVYAADLGKCYAKTSDGFIRAYKDGDYFTLYLVSRELIWTADNTDYKTGNRLEAVSTSFHLRHIEMFESAVDELREELACLAAAGA